MPHTSRLHHYLVAVYECRAVLPDRRDRWQRWINRAVLEGERLVEYQCIGEDITERKRMEEDLHSQLKELKRWQAVMMDREDRVLDLKKEVNGLLKEAGRPARYGGS